MDYRIRYDIFLKNKYSGVKVHDFITKLTLFRGASSMYVRRGGGGKFTSPCFFLNHWSKTHQTWQISRVPWKVFGLIKKIASLWWRHHIFAMTSSKSAFFKGFSGPRRKIAQWLQFLSFEDGWPLIFKVKILLYNLQLQFSTSFTVKQHLDAVS